MPNRTAKFVSAVFMNILAGVSLATMARGETANAEGCLSTPKGETLSGSHWYYRIDHANKRNCWYLRREDGGLSQAVPQNSPSAAAPAAKPSIADARAEIRPHAIHEDNPVASAPAGNEASSTKASGWSATAAVATRWPDLQAATSVPNAKPVPAAPTSGVMQSSADPALLTAPAGPLFNLSVPIRPEIIPTLFAATVGALAFAGAVTLISRRRRRLRRHQAHHSRGPIWETTDDDRIILSDPSLDHRDYRPRFARGVRGAAPSDKRASNFGSRAPRYAQR
jgi:hypothetical protein